MGMDYEYAGSASHPRFEREIAAVAGILGCQKTKRRDELKEAKGKEPFGYWFGFMHDAQPDDEIFAVPNTYPEALAKWLNRPYDSRTSEETAEIWNVISLHPEIKDMSMQIWVELQNRVAYGEGWELYCAGEKT